MIGRIRRLFERKAEGRTYADALIDAGLSDALVYPGGLITRERAAAWTAIHRCVSLIAGAAADAIIDSLAVESDDRMPVRTVRSKRVVDMLRCTPDGTGPALTWIEDAFADMILGGQAVIRVDRSPVSGRDRLTLCHPESAIVVQDRRGRAMVRATPDSSESGAPEAFPLTDCIIARWPRIGGRSAGWSDRRRFFATPPIQSVAGAISLALNSERFAIDFFDRPGAGGRGAAKSNMAISYPDVIPEETQRQLIVGIRSWAEGRGPLLLPNGGKIQQLNPTPADSQLLELRRFQTEEISRLLGVPGFLMGISEGTQGWGQSLAESGRAWSRWSLRLYLNRFLEAISFKLLPDGQKLTVDESRYFRGDSEAIRNLIGAGRPPADGQGGILSRKECRRLYGLTEEYIDDWTTDPVDDMTDSEADDAHR